MIERSWKNGRVRECRLGPGRMDDATRWIERYQRQWERRLGRLDTIIQGRKDALHWPSILDALERVVAARVGG